MIIGLSLIHVQFLLVWANKGQILVQSNTLLFVLDVFGLEGKKKNHLSCVIPNPTYSMLQFQLYSHIRYGLMF